MYFEAVKQAQDSVFQGKNPESSAQWAESTRDEIEELDYLLRPRIPLGNRAIMILFVLNIVAAVAIAYLWLRP